MKNNAITSFVWLILMILSSITLTVGFLTRNGFIYFATVSIFALIFGFLYYIMNSYIVYRKFQHFDLKVDTGIVLFPFLAFFKNKELLKLKVRYYWFLKYVSIIYPFFVAGPLTSFSSAMLFGFSLSESTSVEDTLSVLAIISLASTIVFGWGICYTGGYISFRYV